MALGIQARTPIERVRMMAGAYTCHIATWYWAAREAQSRGLTDGKDLETTVGNVASMPGGPEKTIKDILKSGKWDFAITPSLPPVGCVLYWPGTKEITTTHSAVVTGPDAITGYNQSGWFPPLQDLGAAGAEHSSMRLRDLDPKLRQVHVISESEIVLKARLLDL